jgi:predicted protein tyrosine phosphatase
MIEIYPNLFIGSEIDYETKVRHEAGWSIVQACKEPYHRQALGYSGKAAPKTHPEYLIARRGNRLILNIVDAPDPAYIPKELIDAALEFISTSLTAGDRVLVHCNEGCSRSSSIGLLYLAKFTDRLSKETFLEAEATFRSLYPPYNPKMGMRGYMIQNWKGYT